MANGIAFQLTLVDRLSGPATAGATALKSVNKELKSVSASAKAIVPVRQISVGADKGADKAAAKAAAEAEKAIQKQRVADEKAAAKAILAQERQLQAEKKALAKAAAAEWAAIDKRNANQAKAAAKAEALAAKDVIKAQKAAEKEAAKIAKQKAADQAAQGEAFAEQAALVEGAAAGAAAAVLALAAAFGALVVAGAGLAIQARSAKDDTLEMLAAVLDSQTAAADTYDAIIDITRDVGISQAAAQELAQSLTAAGITNQAMLLDATKAIAQADSVIKGAGQKIQGIIETANAGGAFVLNAKKLVGTGVQMQAVFDEISKATGKGVKQVEAELKAGKISAEVGVAALTKVVDKKFGAIAAGRARGFDESIQRLHDNITRLFDGVNIEPFENALATIVDLFDDSTVAGKALKETVTAAFDGLFSAAAAAGPYIKTFFKGLIIIALQFYIGLKPMLKALGLIGPTAKSSGDGTKTLVAAMARIGQIAGYVAERIAAVGQHKSVLYGLAAAAAVVAAPFVALTAAVGLVVGALVGLFALASYVDDWLYGLVDSAIDAGAALVDGLVNGIVSAGGKLIETVKGLGGDAIKAFKSVFKIQSPSRVMMGVGENISLGLAEGIMAGGKAVNDNMIATVDPESAIPAAAPSNTSTATSSVSLSGVTIQITITGVQNAADLEARMPEIMANSLEQALNTLSFQPAA